MASPSPGGGPPASAHWWQERVVLRHFVCDLLADELSRQRRSSGNVALPWTDGLHLDDDLGVDSLERVALATCLAEALHLHESGIEDYLLVRRRLGDWVDIAGAGLTRYSQQLTFRTSGSAGLGKPCLHSLASLLQETRHHALLFAGRRRILCAVPSHHIYGFLFGVLLPRALGLGADCLIDLRATTPAWLARSAQPGDLVIGYPDFWHAVARTVPQLPEDLIGVTSTAPCPDEVGRALDSAGIARLFHIYGSSETGGIGWRTSWRHPYQLLPHWTFAGEGAALLRTSSQGEPRRVACQDRLVRVGTRAFHVDGRHDEAVQVAGTNVFPARVAQVLRAHPDVREVAVRLMRPQEGTRLKAFVVPRSEPVDETVFLRDLRSWIDVNLAAPERPKALRLGTRLPLTPAGKAADWDVGWEAAPAHRHW